MDAGSVGWFRELAREDMSCVAGFSVSSNDRVNPLGVDRDWEELAGLFVEVLVARCIGPIPVSAGSFIAVKRPMVMAKQDSAGSDKAVRHRSSWRIQ